MTRFLLGFGPHDFLCLRWISSDIFLLFVCGDFFSLAGVPLLELSVSLLGLNVGDMRGYAPSSVAALINAEWLWDRAELRGSNCEFAASDVRGTMLCRTFHDDPAASVVATKVIKEGLSGKTAASGSLDWTLAGEPHVGRYWQAFLKPQYAMDMWMIQLRPRADAFAVDREFGRFFWLDL